MTEPDAATERCSAVIWHGPGHQSKTHCRRKDEHEIHFAIYGRYEQDAYWKGEKVFSGFFDDPPAGSNDLEKLASDEVYR